jgi:2-octaprenylphenol hydroxylase
MKKDSILVCGTGIVGLATALGLAKAGKPVSLLGPRPRAQAAVESDVYCPRVYAISMASQRLLSELGVWAMLDSRRVTAVESMEVYGDAQGAVHLHAWQATEDVLTWIIESSELERVLQQAVAVYGIAWHDDKFQTLSEQTVVTVSGRSLSASLLVGADGAASAVRAAAGISHRSKSYGDVGVVTHLNAQLPHQHRAVQWFTGDSVLALLPLPDTAQGSQVSMVWSMPDAQWQEFQLLEPASRDELLQKRLAAATGMRLGGLTVRSPVLAFPLTLEHSAMIASGVALVGDAAHRVHPLAGQGLNLGLGDVEELIRILRDKESFRSAGDEQVLRRYRRARAEPVWAMSTVTDGLHRLFKAQAAPVVLARNLGMRAVDRIPGLKRILIETAAGRR